MKLRDLTGIDRDRATRCGIHRHRC